MKSEQFERQWRAEIAKVGAIDSELADALEGGNYDKARKLLRFGKGNNQLEKDRTMQATEAREYLKTAVATETGKAALKAVVGESGYQAIIKAPEMGEDKSTIKVAELIRAELGRRYNF